MSGTQLYRLEIHGRPGWFVPAFEARFPEDTPHDEVRTRMALALELGGYPIDAEGGETFSLRPIDGITPGWRSNQRRK